MLNKPGLPFWSVISPNCIRRTSAWILPRQVLLLRWILTSSSFLKRFDFIYGKFVHRDADSYLTVERLGRGRRLGPNQRTLILEMYKNLVSDLWAVRQLDAREQARIACSLLEKGEQPKTEYAAVVVDEIQDLSDIELRIVKAIGESAGNLFLVGDGAQQIYKRGQSLKKHRNKRFRSGFHPAQELSKHHRDYFSSDGTKECATYREI